MSNTIFDTDFLGYEEIIVYENGKIVYEDCVSNLTFEQKHMYSSFDWYLLNGIESAYAIFVG